MATLIRSNDLGSKLIDILGMPKHTTEFNINFKAGDLVKIECKFFPETELEKETIDEVVCIFKEYTLNKKEIEKPKRPKRRMDG